MAFICADLNPENKMMFRAIYNCIPQQVFLYFLCSYYYWDLCMNRHIIMMLRSNIVAGSWKDLFRILLSPLQIPPNWGSTLFVQVWIYFSHRLCLLGLVLFGLAVLQEKITMWWTYKLWQILTWPSKLKVNFVRYHPMIINVHFRFNNCCSFWGLSFKISNRELCNMSCGGGHFGFFDRPKIGHIQTFWRVIWRTSIPSNN